MRWLADGVILLLLLSIAATVRGTPVHQDQKLRATIQDHILDPLVAWQNSHWQRNSTTSLPFVTAAFAQSLDGSMALVDTENGISTSNFPLSGPESMLLTHALRSGHDAILIGGRTLNVDRPRLTDRLWNCDKQPRPVVLDTRLEYSRSVGFTSNRLVNPIVCCSNEAATAASYDDSSILGELLPCRTVVENGRKRLDLTHVLQQLQTLYGIRSVMVEGGAEGLTAFFSHGLVDAVCLSVAPKWLPPNGIRPCLTRKDGTFVDLTSCSPRFVVLGTDVTLLVRWT